MKDILIPKDELLEKVKVNREKHAQDYKEAIDGYVDAVKKAFRKRVKEVEKAPAETDLNFYDLERPEDHTDDYDQVIAMLEMTEEQKVTLSGKDFAQYVLDKWGWKERFTSTSNRYKN